MFKKKDPKHKLVVIGDSLSQGFNNGGIYRTDINFPSFLARCFEPTPQFDQPNFTAQAGIPINLEVLIRGLSEEFGSQINWNEYLSAATHTFKTLKRIKKYWEGEMKDLRVDQFTPYHNQAIWGFAINDSWIVNERKSREYIQNNKESFSVFGVLPEHAKYTTSRLVLNPTLGNQFEENSQIDNVNILQQDGGIENMIVCLGHNNALGSVVNLNLTWSELSDLKAFTPERKHSIYRPEHFEMEYRELAERISKIGAKRVFVPTIPYPTIPPVIRGVNSNVSKKALGYFDYYTRFWIWDEDFDPEKHPYLTKDEAIQIDLAVDEFNEIIKKVAKEYDWFVVPVARNVAGMANRRLGGELLRGYPKDFVQALKRNPATAHLVNYKDEATINTEFLRLNNDKKIIKGGIFSLDGLHPTTIGYGLMANVYYISMVQAGVKFQKKMDWDYIIAQDSLITHPPVLLKELRSVLGYLALGNQERFLKIGKSIFTQVFEHLSTGDQKE